LPLAIELAAARMAVFMPQTLLRRLAQQGNQRTIPLLAEGPPDAPERQRTLDNTIAWSYHLLTAEEQRLFRQLSVFAGGVTFDTAEQVFGATAVRQIEGLVRKSLLTLREDADGEARFTMLETIREFASARLAEHGEAAAAHETHAASFVQLAEDAERQLRGPEQLRWLNRLDDEQGNIRAALSWLAERAEGGDEAVAQVGLCLAGPLWRYWHMRGRYAEAKFWLRRFLDLPAARIPTAARARALYGAGFIEDSVARQEEGLAIQREHGDKAGIAYALFGLGMALFPTPQHKANGQADEQRCEAAVRGSLALYREVEDDFGAAWALTYLGGLAHHKEDYTAARLLYEESLAIRRRLGDLHGIASSLQALALTSRRTGDLTRAEREYEESTDIWRRLGVKTLPVADALSHLAQLKRDRRETDRAEALFEGSLAIYRHLGETQRAAAIEAELSRLARSDEAERPKAGPSPFPWASQQAQAAGLTPREWEVLDLLVLGASTNAIAAKLSISRHTAVRHIASILGKLGAKTRGAAVAKATGLRQR
ncbi:MAG TPA: tetratricopeptide repeat protein, partial [Chloroflexota bacterium]|nr:tetratricopeptide repeat protein [Chloroflexota bacterium]